MHFVYESATYDRKKCFFIRRAYSCSWRGEAAIKSSVKKRVKEVVKNLPKLVLTKLVLVRTGNGKKKFLRRNITDYC